jgi:hypothetical protein
VKKRKLLRRLLDYCPEPSEPLKTFLRRYSVPVTVVISLSVALIAFFLLSQTVLSQSALLPPPQLASRDYNPGVSVGDYVVYGNFVCNREHPEGTICINDLAFKKMEVIAVSGKEITFFHTQQYKNGTSTWADGRTEIWDVEKYMWSDETPDYVDSTLIIAANLTEGECIQLDPAPLPSFYVAETDVRSYLGVSRNVSILHNDDWVDINGELCNVRVNAVYDQLSGVRLESELVTLDGDLVASMSVIETNIFSTSTVSSTSSLQEKVAASIPGNVVFYATTGLAVVVVFVVAGVFLGRKRLRGGEKCSE